MSKNIHLISTDKGQIITKTDKGIFLWGSVAAKDYVEIRKGYSGFHLYITNDEEIKEGDWMYYKHFGEDIICKYDTLGGQNTNVNEHKDYYKKIILTTDKDLIKDGVQKIDDKFLKWFVVNANESGVPFDRCEVVEIKKFNNIDECNYPCGYLYQIIIPEEKPKQETLEEAAENYYSKQSYNEDAFIEGAKWQQKRMYSEEEVRLMLSESFKASQEGYNITSDEIINQFKNKL